MDEILNTEKFLNKEQIIKALNSSIELMLKGWHKGSYMFKEGTHCVLTSLGKSIQSEFEGIRSKNYYPALEQLRELILPHIKTQGFSDVVQWNDSPITKFSDVLAVYENVKAKLTSV